MKTNLNHNRKGIHEVFRNSIGITRGVDAHRHPLTLLRENYLFIIGVKIHRGEKKKKENVLLSTSQWICKGFTEKQTHIRSAEPDVPHVVTDGFGSRHCT